MNTRRTIAAIAVAALWPATAWAHPGHGVAGFSAGLLHPLTGLDHLAALLLVGICGGVLPGERRWRLPAAFLAGMTAGFAAGVALIGEARLAEALIVVSLVVLGLAAALRLRAAGRLPAGLALAATALFGAAHGLAHGIETPHGAVPVQFAGGFVLTSGLVEAIGLWLARVLPAPVLRLLGAGGAVLGLALAAGG